MAPIKLSAGGGNVFRLIIGLLAFLSHPAFGQQISIQQKDNLLKGYMLSCVPTIQSQLPRTEQAKIAAYCSCVGGKTFKSISKTQYEYIKSAGQLPPEIETRRNVWRNQCASQLD